MAADSEPDYEFEGIGWFVEKSSDGILTQPCLTRGAAIVLAEAIDKQVKQAKDNDDWYGSADPELAAEKIDPARYHKGGLPYGWTLWCPWPPKDKFILCGPKGIHRFVMFDSPTEAIQTAWDASSMPKARR